MHFGEVPIADVFDLRGFNLNAKLDIDPDFLKADEPSTTIDHDHGEHWTIRARRTLRPPAPPCTTTTT